MSMQRNNLLVPLLIILLGVLTWIAGNLLNDKQGGTNIGLTLIGIGGGLAKQSDKPTVNSENIENVELSSNVVKPNE